MRLLPLILLILLSFSSCKSTRLSKKSSNNTSISRNLSASPTKSYLAKTIVSNAKAFNGTKYKFGGTSKKGMDCSGLIYVAFKKEGIGLPRVSRDMAKQGQQINIKNTKVGDLLFFKTNKNRNVINHVGLVVSAKRGLIEFIHSTTSKGVITSSLSERYWKSAFIEVRRIL